VAREAAGLDVAFEEDESGTRVGFEACYTGPRAPEENPLRAGPPAYTTLGILASQRFGRATIYVNRENPSDVRQTRCDPLLRPTPVKGDGERWTRGECQRRNPLLAGCDATADRLAVEHLAELLAERVRREWLVDERDSRIEHPVVGDRVLGIT
jgi:hypothetical protein